MSFKSVIFDAIKRRNEHDHDLVQSAKQKCAKYQDTLDEFKETLLSNISTKIADRTYHHETHAEVIFVLDISLIHGDIPKVTAFFQDVVDYIESEGVQVVNKHKNLDLHPVNEIASGSKCYHFCTVGKLQISWGNLHHEFNAHHGIDTSQITTDNDGSEEVTKMIEQFEEFHHSHD